MMLFNFSIKLLALSTLFVFIQCGGEKPKEVTENQTTEPQKEETAKMDNRKNILFFGNSLTAGYGLNEEDSFPSLLQAKVDSLGMDYNIINGGLSGETTSGGLKRIDWVLNQPVDVFVLELGANDMLRGLPLAETEKNLRAILDKVRKKYPAADLYLAEMMAAPNMGANYVTNFQQIYSKIATADDVELIPFFLEGVSGNKALLLPDGKHPNAKGQKIAAQNMWKGIQPSL